MFIFTDCEVFYYMDILVVANKLIAPMVSGNRLW